MATLYDVAESNIRKTFLLISIFLLMIIFLGWILSYLFRTTILLWIAVIYSILMSFFSYWYSDKIVLRMTKAKPVTREGNPELYRIVENLCITAGLPVPKIYILDEKQPNAFATGRDPNHAAIVFTKGLLEKLDKLEIEGVASHELSHIKNRDILLGSVVVVLAGVIALVSDWVLRVTFWGGESREEKGSGGIILLLLIIISVILAPLAATLIRLAVSRKREFLADASGALLTRYPEGLARALEKIAADKTPMKVASNSTAHLFISSPFKGKSSGHWFARLFMTHPPVEERIKMLRSMDI